MVESAQRNWEPKIDCLQELVNILKQIHLIFKEDLVSNRGYLSVKDFFSENVSALVEIRPDSFIEVSPPRCTPYIFPNSNHPLCRRSAAIDFFALRSIIVNLHGQTLYAPLLMVF